MYVYESVKNAFDVMGDTFQQCTVHPIVPVSTVLTLKNRLSGLWLISVRTQEQSERESTV